MKIRLILALLMVSFAYGQKGTNSPFSYYGLGDRRYEGNIENALMGGMNAYVDSISVDVRNPASLAKLKRTVFSLASSYDIRRMHSQSDSYSERTFLLDYVNLSFPIYKNLGFSVGLRPYTSVGYRLLSKETVQGHEQYYSYEGSGGVNQAYMALGYQVINGLRIGVAGGFNFGRSNLSNLYSSPVLAYITREDSQSLYRGGSFTMGVQYERALTEKLSFNTGLSYKPQTTLRSDNNLTLYSLLPNNGNFIIKDSREVTDASLRRTHLTLPSEWAISAGVGNPNEWFVGATANFVQMQNFSNPFVTSSFVSYENAYKFSVGGFYLPHNTAYTKYWKRVTYRAGLYYERTGIVLRDKSINDYGMTFGATLPMKGLSNVSFGATWGRKGDTSLLKENYFTLHLALTLSDKWFQRTKYH